MADLVTDTLQFKNNKMRLILKGGDASESYTVKIDFDKLHVSKTVSSSGEFPNPPYQITAYNY